MRTCLTVTLLLWASLAGQAAADGQIIKLVRQAQSASSVQQLSAGQGAGFTVLLSDVPAGYSYELWPPAVEQSGTASHASFYWLGGLDCDRHRPRQPRAP
jgi:hypothetical protein